MDLSFSQEQEILRSTARRFMEKECGVSYIKQIADGTRSFGEQEWRKLSEMGWTAILIPEEHDGLGLGFVDLGIVLEEMGKGPLPGPFLSSVVLGAETIRLAGSAAQKRHYLPRLAAGEVRATLACMEAGDLDPSWPSQTAARRSGNGFILEGTKIFVPDADLAHILICVAMSESRPALFVVEREHPGVNVRNLVTADMTTSLAEVRFGGVELPAEAMLGDPAETAGVLRQVLSRINAAYAMDMVGGGQRALELAVEYAKTRVQFGQAIGGFQAIKHKCAELLMEVECGRAVAYFAAWAQDQNESEAALGASSAKVFCSGMYRKATREALQILGGIGFSWEHELHIYLKRAKCLGALFGDPAFHRERLATDLGY